MRLLLIWMAGRDPLSGLAEYPHTTAFAGVKSQTGDEHWYGGHDQPQRQHQ
jgi:hypothetical protein